MFHFNICTRGSRPDGVGRYRRDGRLSPTHHQCVSSRCLDNVVEGDVIKGDIIFKKVSGVLSVEFPRGIQCPHPLYYISLYFNSNNVTHVISPCLQGSRG